MTKQNKKLICKAAKLIANGIEHYSCNAVDNAAGHKFSMNRQKYCDFYKDDGKLLIWDFEDFGLFRDYKVTAEDAKNHRVIALLLFAEAGL